MVEWARGLVSDHLTSFSFALEREDESREMTYPECISRDSEIKGGNSCCYVRLWGLGNSGDDDDGVGDDFDDFDDDDDGDDSGVGDDVDDDDDDDDDRFSSLLSLPSIFIVALFAFGMLTT